VMIASIILNQQNPFALSLSECSAEVTLRDPQGDRF
jgi:hypothetical protein